MLKILLTLLLLIAPTSAWALKERQCPRTSGVDWCALAQEQARKERAAFQRGDYTAMRNRAFCLWTGCDGAFERDPEASCAIRREIVRRHNRRFDSSDETHLANCSSRGL